MYGIIISLILLIHLLFVKADSKLPEWLYGVHIFPADQYLVEEYTLFTANIWLTVFFCYNFLFKCRI